MGTIPFSAYIASRPAASTPLASTDRLLVLQDGVVKMVASSDTGGYNSTPVVLIDASITPVTLLPSDGEVVYSKTDETVNIANFDVSVVGQTMCQDLINGLDVKDIPLRVKLIGVHWYKTG